MSDAVSQSDGPVARADYHGADGEAIVDLLPHLVNHTRIVGFSTQSVKAGCNQIPTLAVLAAFAG